VKALVGFAGFGGVDIALRDFGFQVTGIEIDSAIAEVNRVNGGHCLTADLLDIDPADYVGWNLFHFSPPCPNFSVAKSDGAETEDDLALARKICQFIRVGRPEYFTLENVWLYRKSLSWLLIWYTLLEEGYGVDAWNLNAADYGVPQSRRRMIVIARRDGRKPAKPFPTHSKNPDMFTSSWRGWYEAIADLIPDLPEGEFASWQRDRLPGELKSFLLMTGNTNRNGIDNVMVTIQTRPPSQCPHRAFIIGQGERSKPKSKNMPADTITANTNQTGVKAFIVGGQYQTPNNGQPRTVQNKTANSPVWTICSSDRLDTRIWKSGKVVLMTPRALARFQDFPDWFVLPGDRGLACYGIGNAIPPGLYQAVLESMRLNYESK
jgi:DNA (cytosine-5)-methyltransferase 1